MTTIIYPFPLRKQLKAQHLQLSISFLCNDSKYIISDIHYCQSEPEYALPDSNDSDFAKKVKKELECYLDDAKFQFSLPCDIQLGTPFQQRVWQVLSEIPLGTVKTYGELAKELNTSARAIGNACRQNFFPIIIPCHRVVSAAGIGGYAGDTLENQKGQINFLQIKQWLLDHEKRNLK